MQIYLIGFMGAGKSTVAKYLAPALNRKLIDTDQAIEEAAGMTIPQYFDTYGEEAFRKLEHEVLENVSRGEDAIISCGGGVALFENNVACMKEHGRIYLLSISPEEVFGRLKNDTKRPLLKGRKSVEGIAELMEQRVPFYEKAADEIFSCNGKTSKMVAREIEKSIKK